MKNRSSTKHDYWSDWVVKNPMLIEIQRFRRRYASFRGKNAANAVVLVLILMGLVGFLLSVLRSDGTFSPHVLVMLQTALLALFAPGMLYGSVAGERERRSWDLLLVAPITKQQIVFGKFIGALAMLGAVCTLFAFPILVAAATFHKTNWIDLVEAEAISIAFSTTVCAWTILISARVNRPLMALGVSLGTLALALIVIPGFLGILGVGDQMQTVLYLHPFVALSQIMSIDEVPGTANFMSPWAIGWPHVLIYLAVTAVLIGWSVNTLTFAENDVKFLPKGNKDA